MWRLVTRGSCSSPDDAVGPQNTTATLRDRKLLLLVSLRLRFSDKPAAERLPRQMFAVFGATRAEQLANLL